MVRHTCSMFIVSCLSFHMIKCSYSLLKNLYVITVELLIGISVLFRCCNKSCWTIHCCYGCLRNVALTPEMLTTVFILNTISRHSLRDIPATSVTPPMRNAHVTSYLILAIQRSQRPFQKRMSKVFH